MRLTSMWEETHFYVREKKYTAKVSNSNPQKKMRRPLFE